MARGQDGCFAVASGGNVPATPGVHTTYVLHPLVSPIHNCPTVSVMLPILGDEPRSEAKQKEFTSPKLTMEAGGRDSQPVAEEGCTEGQTLEQGTVVSMGLETRATGAGPSLLVGPEQPEQVS